MLTKPCQQCGKIFSKPSNETLKAWTDRHKFCSRLCAKEAMCIDRKCEHCGKVWHGRKQKYCSRSCNSKATGFQQGHKMSDETRKKISEANKGNKRCVGRTPWNKGIEYTAICGDKHPQWTGSDIEVKCFQCGKMFGVRPWRLSKAKFCGEGCYHSFRDKGITDEISLLRVTLEYKEWRRSVYRRDSYTCQNCGDDKSGLEAHHIKKFSDYPESRLDVNNGLTLCRKCHKKTDNYGSKKTKTVTQLQVA